MNVVGGADLFGKSVVKVNIIEKLRLGKRNLKYKVAAILNLITSMRCDAPDFGYSCVESVPEPENGVSLDYACEKDKF